MAKKPEFWEYPLGADADVNALDRDLDNTKGDATLRGLFPVLTSTRLKDGGIPPQRKDLNALFKLIGENIYFQQHGGFYEWDAEITYDKDAIVMKDGVLFQAKLQTEGADPLTNTGIWNKLIEVSSADLNAIRDMIPRYATTQTAGVVTLSNTIDPEDNLSAITPAGVSTLKNSVDGLDARIDNVVDTIDQLSGGSVSAAEDIATLKKDVTNLKTNDTKQDGDIETLQNDLGTLSSRVDGLDQFNVEGLSEKVTELETDLTNKSVQIDATNNELNQVKEELENIKPTVQSVTTLTHDVYTNKNDISELSESLDKYKESIGTKFSGIYNFQDNEEYTVGSIVSDGNKIYKCVKDIVKTGRPVPPTAPADGASDEEIAQFQTDMEKYDADLDAWLEQSANAPLDSREYWIPLNEICIYKWSNSIFYNTGDIVLYNHKLYEALQDHVGSNANIGNANVWKELSSTDKTIGVFEYSKTQAFAEGSIVMGSDNILYRAKSSTIGNDPTTSPTYWTAIGGSNSSSSGTVTNEEVMNKLEALQSTINDKPDNGVFAYNKDKTYETDDIVYYNGLLWRASQSTTGHAPADNSDFFVRLNNNMRHKGEDLLGVFKFISSGENYKKDDIVEYGGQLYKSLSDNNLGVNPSGSTSWQRLCPPAADDSVIKELKQDITDCETANNIQDSRLDALEEFKNTYSGIDTNSINASIESLETKLNNADIPGLTQRVSDLESADNSDKVDSLLTDVSQLKAFKTQQDATNTAYANKFDTIDSSISAIGDLPQTVSTLSTKVDNIEKTMPDDLSSDIDALQTKGTDLENRLGTLETTVQNMGSSSGTDVDVTAFNTLKGRVDTMEPKVSKNVTDIGALDTRVTQLETKSYVTESDLTSYAKKTDIPEVPDTSTLATKSELSAYAKKTELPDTSSFVTSSDLSEYALKSEIPEVPDVDLSAYAKSADVASTYAKKTDLSEYAKKSDISSGGSSGGSTSSGSFGRFFLDATLNDVGFLDMWYQGEQGAISSIELDSSGLKIHVVDGKLLNTITLHLTEDFSAFSPRGSFSMPIKFIHDKATEIDVLHELWDAEGNLAVQNPEYHIIPTATWAPAGTIVQQTNVTKLNTEGWFDVTSSDEITFRGEGGANNQLFTYSEQSIDIVIKITL